MKPTGRLRGRNDHMGTAVTALSADVRVAEAIARVLSRYAVDYGSGVEVNMSHDGVEVTYVAATAMNSRAR
jgi:hypothetical protein